jgi:hypothetical protein
MTESGLEAFASFQYLDGATKRIIQVSGDIRAKV